MFTHTARHICQWPVCNLTAAATLQTVLT